MAEWFSIEVLAGPRLRAPGRMRTEIDLSPPATVKEQPTGSGTNFGGGSSSRSSCPTSSRGIDSAISQRSALPWMLSLIRFQGSCCTGAAAEVRGFVARDDQSLLLGRARFRSPSPVSLKSMNLYPCS